MPDLALFVDSRAGRVLSPERRSIFDHWAAFQESFTQLRELLEEVPAGGAAGRRRPW